MFWISYSVTFVLASVIAIALMAIRLVLSVVGRAFGSIPATKQEKSVTHYGIVSARSRR
jgi:uncharacterized membrane protein